MKNKLFALLALLVVVSLMVAACGSTPEPTKAPEPTKEEAAPEPTKEEAAAEPTKEEAPSWRAGDYLHLEPVEW